MAKDTPANTPATANKSYAIDADVPVPEFKRKATRTAQYPFDQLEVGQSFHVSQKDHPEVDLVTRLGSSVSAARARYSAPATNPDGSPKMRKNRKGETIQAKQPTRDFRIAQVNDKDPRGAGVRVFRTA